MAAETTIQETVRGVLEKAQVDPGEWAYEAMAAVFVSYDCDNSKCPSRPAWDTARSDMFERLAAQLDREIDDLTTTRITDAFVAFASEHPEAPRVEART